MASVFKVNRGTIYKYAIFRKTYLRKLLKKVSYESYYFNWSTIASINNFKHNWKYSKRPRLYCFYSGRFRSVVKPVYLSRMVFKYFAFNGLLNGIVKASW